MFDYEKIRKLVHEYYVRNGVVVKFDGNYELTNQDTILQAKIAVFLMNEARQDFRDEIDEKEVRDNNFDGYLNKLVKKYAINDDHNNYPQNIAIWNVVGSDGHFEVDDYSGDLAFLKTEFGEAIIRYAARKRGFDMDDIEIETTPNEKGAGGSKIVIDYKKVPIIIERKQKYIAPQKKPKNKVEEQNEQVKRQTTSSTGPMPKKPLELTYAELKLNEKVVEAKKAGDGKRLAHWNFMLDELYRGALDTGNLEQILKDPVDEVETVGKKTSVSKTDEEYLAYAKEQLQVARDYNDAAGIRYWSKMIRFSDPNLIYARDEMSKAEESHDEAMVTYWQGIIDSILNEPIEETTKTMN